MKWFQHDSNASQDAKIKKLILRHGAIGYAVYFHCLELIAADLNQQNINFELEHDAEIIADNLKINGDSETAGIDKVNKILKTIIDLGLFTTENNHVFCFKMAKRLDNTISRNPEINKIKQLCSDYVVPTQKLGAEENRIDQKRSEENREKKSISTNKKPLFDEFNKCIRIAEKGGEGYHLLKETTKNALIVAGGLNQLRGANDYARNSMKFEFIDALKKILEANK